MVRKRYFNWQNIDIDAHTKRGLLMLAIVLVVGGLAVVL